MVIGCAEIDDCYRFYRDIWGVNNNYLVCFFMWKHIVLRMEMGLDKGYHSAVKEDYSEYMGQTGVALTALRPAGTAMIDNKRLDVVSVDDFIEVDMPIQVVSVNGAKVTVEKSRQQTD